MKERLTQRAPDWWDSPRQKGAHYAQTNPVKAASSRPTHQRVTQTVRLPKGSRLMRKRFSSKTLKQHFSIAWSCLPEKTQDDLYKFIRQVREVKSLEGTYIGCPNGTRYGPIEDGEGFTFLYKDDEIAFCDIILRSSLVEVSQAYAISTILHELAHALDYFISPENAVKSARFNAESNAWDKAISWAKEGISDSVLSEKIEYVALRAKLKLQLVELTEITKAA